MEHLFKSPQTNFLDDIYHPNIFETGRLCMHLYFDKWQEWSVLFHIAYIIRNAINVVDLSQKTDRDCSKTTVIRFLMSTEEFNSEVLQVILPDKQQRH